ncbi:polyprenyl synthetase family protein [Verrucomicrobium spinosum]|uniref:polyprenyl synthetase family protein n=1 Tax=Verrucomicrobium spinosum TaxID=2736 RepID=UPI0009467CA8|nr:polyprenyl synthetase family protein [Verrucomicrobium spinosum]
MSTVAVRSAQLPPAVPITVRRFRQPKKNIPQTKVERDHILGTIRKYLETAKLVPPAPLDEMRYHAEKIVADNNFNPIYRDYIGVLLSNELWRETLATIPYEKRLLLMPKCLRVESKCPAPFDEFGLLCKQCGLCTIQDFQNEAEKLGYAVLVAEGSAIVMSLIQTGKIEAIVGISCLPVLERTFPYVEAAAIPAVAVPLLQDDCIDTTVDIDWVWDYIHLTSEDKTRRLNLNKLHEDVREWFTRESLDALLGKPHDRTEEIAREWLARAGNRWRPFLTVASYQALREDPEGPLSDDLKKAAIAVECFHKASLVHDDIEDNDAQRYGEATLHAEHGMPVALNVGDLLIGEGYRLLADSNVRADYRTAMLKIAAEGQRELCRGQGAELLWNNHPVALSSTQVLEIFRSKTAPAFEVALKIGAALSGRLDEVEEALHEYSEALGIAYQIHDDLDDLATTLPRTTLSPSAPASCWPSSASAARERSKTPWRGSGMASSRNLLTRPRSAPGQNPAPPMRRPCSCWRATRNRPYAAFKRGQRQPQGAPPSGDRQDLQRPGDQRLVPRVRGEECHDRGQGAGAVATPAPEPAPAA